ncbi:MAG: DUF1573 domain-containing protein [Vicingaceae bacterium]
MKNIFFLTLIALGALTACESDSQKEEKVSTDLINNPSTAAEGEDESGEELPAFEFEEEVIDFGEISQGEKVARQYTFTNTGKSNLIIANAKGSCGCTVPRYPKQPIKPGQKGVIEVVFDSNGKEGRIHKTITLLANTVPNRKVLAIKGEVLVPTKN